MGNRWNISLYALFFSLLLVTGCGEQNLSVDELKVKIEQAINANDKKGAIIYYRNLIAKDDKAEHRLALASLYFNYYDHGAAAKEYQKAKAMNAAMGDWLIPLAVSWIQLNEHSKIFSELDESQIKYKDLKSDVLALKAWASTLDRDYKKAQSYLDASVALFSDNQVALYVAAVLFLKEKQFQQAQLAIEKVTLPVLMGESKLLLSRIYLSSRNLEAADKLLEELSLEFPNDPRILVRQTNLLISQRDGGRVEKNLRTLSQNFENSMFTHLLHGKWFFVQKKYELARDVLQKAAAVIPDHPEVNMFLGLVNAELQQWDKAVSYLNLALQKFPNHSQTLFALTKVYLFGLKQPERAVELLLSHQAAYVNNVNFHFHLIDALMANKQYVEALNHIERLKETNPDLHALNVSLAMAKFRLGDVDSALDVLDENSQQEGQELSSKLLKAKINIENGQFDAAEKTVEELKLTQMSEIVIKDLEAQLSLARGDIEKAKLLFAQLTKESPQLKSAWIQLAGFEIKSKKINELKQIISDMSKYHSDDVDLMMIQLALARLEKNSEKSLSLMLAIWKKDTGKIIVARDLINNYLSVKPFQAEQIAQRLLAYHSDKAMSHYNYGKVLIRLKKDSEAVKSFEKAIDIEPENVANYLGYIESLKLSDRLEDVEKQYDIIAKKFPDNQYVLSDFIRFLIRSDKFDKASIYINKLKSSALRSALLAEQAYRQKDFQKAIQLVKAARKEIDTQELVLLHSQILKGAKRPNDAIAELEKWLTKHEGDNEIQLSLSNFQLQTDQSADALNGYLTLLDRFPNNLLLLNNVTWILIEKNDSGSLQYAKKLNAFSPETPAFIDTIAWSEILFGQAQQGVSRLESLLAKGMYFPEAEFHLAMGYRKVGQSEKARTLLQNIVSANRSGVTVAKAKKVLESL